MDSPLALQSLSLKHPCHEYKINGECLVQLKYCYLALFSLACGVSTDNSADKDVDSKVT